MCSIEPVLTSEIQQHIGSQTVAEATAFKITISPQLVEQAAHLSFNKDDLLFLRAHDRDYHNKAGSSTFYPIYREDPLLREEVTFRFILLKQASRNLVDLLTDNKIAGNKDVRRKISIPLNNQTLFQNKKIIWPTIHTDR